MASDSLILFCSNDLTYTQRQTLYNLKKNGMHGYFKGNTLITYSNPQRPEGDRIFRRAVRPSTRPNTGATNDVMDTVDHTSLKRV